MDEIDDYLRDKIRREELDAVPGQVECEGPHESPRCEKCRGER